MVGKYCRAEILLFIILAYLYIYGIMKSLLVYKIFVQIAVDFHKASAPEDVE